MRLGATLQSEESAPRGDAERRHSGPEDAATLAPPSTWTAPIGRRSTPQETPYPFTLSIPAGSSVPDHPFILLQQWPSRLKRKPEVTELR